MSGNLNGYVVRGQERPVANAAITVLQSPGRHADLSPLTDADGWFALDNLIAGFWHLRAQGPDGATGEGTVQVWDDSLSELTIILGENSGPRPDIYLEQYNDTKDDDLSTSRESVKSAPDGPRTAPRAHKGGQLAPGSVVGQVTDAQTGEPVAEALVVVTDGPGPLPDGAVTSDSDGFFVIPAMAPGDWALRVDVAGSRQEDLVVAVLSGRHVNVTVVLA